METNTTLAMPSAGAPLPRDLEGEIRRLKRELNAVILAHYYQESEIQDLADFVGDSLALAQAGGEDRRRRDRLLRRPLHGRDGEDPEPGQAGAAAGPRRRAARSPTAARPAAFEAFKDKHPGAFVVTYINCSAAVKAMSDVICTSSNAVKIVEQIPEGPADRLRARPAPGPLRDEADRPGDGPLAGHLHRPRDVQREEAGAAQGGAPGRRGRRPPRVRGGGARSHADFIGSTKAHPRATWSRARSTEFIVVTEAGILHQMEQQRAGQEAHPGAAGQRLRLQRVPAHEAQHAGEALPGCMRDEAPQLVAPARAAACGARAAPAHARVVLSGRGAPTFLGWSAVAAQR